MIDHYTARWSYTRTSSPVRQANVASRAAHRRMMRVIRPLFAGPRLHPARAYRYANMLQYRYHRTWNRANRAVGLPPAWTPRGTDLAGREVQT